MGFQNGLSGLNSASKFLDVIGNNVANANTVGFKSSRAEFADVYANSLTSSSTQVGIGGKTAAVTQQFAEGNLTSTNSPLDMAIQGNGFFRVLDNNGSVNYTRNGQFQLDKNGFIVNNGQKLTGYGTNSNGQLVTGTTPAPIQIQTANVGAKATGSTGLDGAGVKLGVNLDARAPIISRGTTVFTAAGVQLDQAAGVGTVATGFPTTLRIADSTGGYHTLAVSLTNIGPNVWQASTALDGATPDTPGPILNFDATTGKLTTTQPVSLQLSPTNPVAPAFTLNLNFTGAVQSATPSATSPNFSINSDVNAKATVSVSNANLDPTAAAGTAVAYTVNGMTSTGASQPFTVTLTSVGPGTNSWTPSFDPASNATPAPVFSNLVFDASGKLVSGSPVTVQYTNADGNNDSVMYDLSAVTQATGPTTNGLAAVRSTTPVTATDPSTFTSSTSATVYDAQGAAHTETYFFTKVAPNIWEVQTSFDGATPIVQPGFVSFKGDGSLASGGTFATNSAIVSPNGATSPLSFTTALTGSTQYGSAFGVNVLNQDGYGDGTLTGLSIGADGVVQGRYSNGQNRTVGQIVLYNFTNPQGLQSLGDNRWAESFASGQARQGTPGSSDFGSIQASTVEDSNVDLTKELVDMITAQRTYQANAQTIKTQDQVLQTLVSLR